MRRRTRYMLHDMMVATVITVMLMLLMTAAYTVGESVIIFLRK